MAPAKLDRIISVSSEDSAFPAENLLKNAYSDKKWKCKTPGEKQISVIIQLEKSEKIRGVDIGNCGSAFVEVLVGKSCVPDDFKVLVPASSLMTLQEAKLGNNLSSVRFFKEDAIDKEVGSEKWDRVKVVCTQPFNKIIQYGLAFIVIHTTNSEQKENNSSSLGIFKLKEIDGSEKLLPGSLFSKRKEKDRTNIEDKAAAAIRVASITGVIEKKMSPKIPSRLPEFDSFKKHSPERQSALRKDTPKEKKTEVSKEKRKDPHTPHIEKPFNRLLEGVTFAISGFQNPLRGEIRGKAVAMGAKYKPDWDNTCTHLICAFPNTPKFNQVLRRGKIVTKDWVETCHNRRIRLPWRRFALHPPDKKRPESEDEIFELVERPPSPSDNRRRVSPGSSSGDDTEEEIERVLKNQRALVAEKANGRVNGVVKKSPRERNNEELMELLNFLVLTNESSSKTRDDNSNVNKKEKSHTDKNTDKVDVSKQKKVHEKASPVLKKRKIVSESVLEEDTYDLDTEEEDEDCDSKKFNLPSLPTFFDGINFHVGNDLLEEDSIEIRRYIIAHKGRIVEEDDLSDKKVSYLIAFTNDEVTRIKQIKPEVVAVRPEWIWKAHDEGRIPPSTSFLLK